MIEKIYNHIYSFYSGNRLFELPNTERNNKLITSFEKSIKILYHGSVDSEFIFNFTVYQFRYYEDKDTRFGKGKVQLNWIYGQKAIQRWQDKPEKWLYFNDLFVERYNIPPIDSLLKYEPKNTEKTSFVNTLERKRFFNTEMGLIHCSQLKIFDRFSKECLVCKYKDICKNMDKI